VELTVPRDTIDKRTFLATLPCATRGWFAHREAGGAPTPADEWAFFGGNQVGEAARAHLGPASAELQFETTFHWGAFAARADALRRNGDGWDLIEVKSSKEPEPGKKIDRELVDDIAYTLMVARGAGAAIERCTLLLLSRSYRLGSAVPLFVAFDVTDAALARAAEFGDVAPELGELVLADTRPAAALRSACGSCPSFADACLGSGVETSIFVLPRLGEKRIEKIRPIVDLFQVPVDIDLTDNQRRVFDVIRSGTPRVMSGLGRLDDIVWPAHYFDFETVAPFLPWFEGDGVHETHPFQYSIHHRDSSDGELTHHEYLAPLEGDWRRELVERLLNDLGDSGSVVVYTDFEERRLRGLAAAFRDLAEPINAVIARLFDLHEVVKEGYCHPAFRGRTSIKTVFPALVAGSAYRELAIAEGQSASGVFGLMRAGRYDPATIDGWRRDLLEYCKLDTMAMVGVHDALARVRANQ
jgi:hypothetical protein